MLNRFFKPTIKAKLIKKDGMDLVKMTVKNSNNQLTLVILISIIKQIAIKLDVDYRALLNRLLKLDSSIKREEKKMKKAIRYPKNKK